MKKFIFKWENAKEKIERTNTIKAEEPKDAVNIFMNTFGNLKKNNIVSIQEIDDNGEPVGLPIVPID